MGDVSLRSPTVMVNLLGDVWEAAGGSPDWGCGVGDAAALHCCMGRAEYRVGRKMGHITVTGDTVQEALKVATAARDAAGRSSCVRTICDACVVVSAPSSRAVDPSAAVEFVPRDLGVDRGLGRSALSVSR